MAVNLQGAPAPIRATRAHDFFSCNPEGDCLFSVRAGIPASNALESASCFLDVARSSVRQIAEDGGSASEYAADHLITLAKALIDALPRDTSGDDPGSRQLSAVLERIGELFDGLVLIVNPEIGALAANDASQFIEWVRDQRERRCSMSRAIKGAPEHAEQDAVDAFAVRIAAVEINPFVGFVGFKDTADNVHEDCHSLNFQLSSFLDAYPKRKPLA